MNRIASRSMNTNLRILLVFIVLVFGFLMPLNAQNAVLVDIDAGSRKAWIVLEKDRIGLELDSSKVEDFASSITSEGVILNSSNRLYSWSEIKFIDVPNRYLGKKSKQIYWSVVCTGLFIGLATDLYVSQTDPYMYIPLSALSLLTAPVWGILVPVIIELADGPNNRIRLEIEGEVKVEPYQKKVRYSIQKGATR